MTRKERDDLLLEEYEKDFNEESEDLLLEEYEKDFDEEREEEIFEEYYSVMMNCHIVKNN